MFPSSQSTKWKTRESQPAGLTPELCCPRWHHSAACAVQTEAGEGQAEDWPPRHRRRLFCVLRFRCKETLHRVYIPTQSNFKKLHKYLHFELTVVLKAKIHKWDVQKKILEYTKIMKMDVMLRGWNYRGFLSSHFYLSLFSVFLKQTRHNKNTTSTFNKHILINIIISKG